jgi:hypothetical protein
MDKVVLGIRGQRVAQLERYARGPTERSSAQQVCRTGMTTWSA